MNENVFDDIKKELNFCKYMNYAHIIMSFFGFLGYMARKIFFTLFINVISIILSIVGYQAIEEINKQKIIVYAVCTSSLFGMVLLYEIIADLFSESYQTEAPPQSFVFLVITLPYLIDLASGLMSLKLCYTFQKYEDLEFKRKYNQILIVEKGKEKNYKEESYLADEMCAICLSEKRNIIFYRCGHKVCCKKCSEALKKRNCPICRADIQDCIKEYDV
ncbi:unnamed protein product [Paramecium sonneborni]|uniref:RING-type domain-containing protein n=1 Tax=Paramecium sonneborni TaxID=65129 RepID=A0A8S1NQI0_9CILI|nr:unnamed protein product [Paramecium sonneborni]